jgi:hypothetical protein
VSSEAKNLAVITAAVRQHNATCAYPATAVRMNPFEVERLGWDEILGVPIEPDPSMGSAQFRIDCGKPTGAPSEEEEATVANPIRAEPVFA